MRSSLAWPRSARVHGSDSQDRRSAPLIGATILLELKVGGSGAVETSRSGRHRCQQAVWPERQALLKTYLRDLLLYRLTLEAQTRIAESPLSKREIVRRLGTSAAQLYRLLDQTNYRKSVDQVLALLQVLNCDVDLVVWTKTA